jgi:hypothetical protein
MGRNIALAAALVLTLSGCTAPFEERFAPQVELATELNLGSVGDVVDVTGNGGGPTPRTVVYIIEGDDVVSAAEQSLVQASFTPYLPTSHGRSWSRTNDGLSQMVLIIPFSSGESFTTGIGEDAGTYVSHAAGARIVL